jgi:hypothetical protein
MNKSWGEQKHDHNDLVIYFHNISKQHLITEKIMHLTFQKKVHYNKGVPVCQMISLDFE